MKKDVSVAMIGCGAFMGRQHLPNIAKMPNVKIRILCDLNGELLKKRQEEYKVENITSNADEIFEDPAIDVVLVGTRSNMHANFILEAAKAGKNVYVEKPMTMSMEETGKVMQAIKESGINVGVGFNRRFAPGAIEAKRLLQSYKSGPANIYYRIVDDHRIRPHYIFDMNDGGGHLLQECCHIFDLLAWLLESEPVEIYCTGPLETDNVLIMKFADESIATVICGGKGGLCYPKECMEVFCSSHTLVLDNFYEMRYDGPEGNFIKHFTEGSKNMDNFKENSMTEYYRAYFDMRPEDDLTGEHAANGLPIPSLDKGHKGLMKAFIDAISSGEKFSVGASAGARATICALKGYESIAKNIPCKIDQNIWI